MGLFDRISRILRANVNDWVSNAEDPEKILEQTIIDMQEDLVKLRQAAATAIATQKRTEQRYLQSQQEITAWQKRAELALQKGEENLAREALVRKKTHADAVINLKAQLDQQINQAETLKRSMVAVESKISEARAKKDMLKARYAAAKATEQIQSTLGQINTDSAMAAFDRMEEKVLQVEARSQAAAELAGEGLDSKFAQLESSDVDVELMQLKAQFLGSAIPTDQAQLPAAEQSQPTNAVSEADQELEELKRQLDQL
jgi:phage shock protein A